MGKVCFECLTVSLFLSFQMLAGQQASVINRIVVIVQSAVQTKSVTWPFCSMNISCVLERVISGLNFSHSVQVSMSSYDTECI